MTIRKLTSRSARPVWTPLAFRDVLLALAAQSVGNRMRRAG